MEGGSEGGTEDYFFKFVQTLKDIDSQNCALWLAMALQCSEE